MRRLSLCLAAALSVTSCGGKKDNLDDDTAGGAPSSASSGQKVDPATAGDITGVVTLDGWKKHIIFFPLPLPSCPSPRSVNGP